jgi:hypothetical protein
MILQLLVSSAIATEAASETLISDSSSKYYDVNFLSFLGHFDQDVVVSNADTDPLNYSLLQQSIPHLGGLFIGKKQWVVSSNILVGYETQTDQLGNLLYYNTVTVCHDDTLIVADDVESKRIKKDSVRYLFKTAAQLCDDQNEAVVRV